MKQLHVREPWSDLAVKSSSNVLDDLLNRIQVLETKVRELEMQVSLQSRSPVRAEDPISVRPREAVPVGV